MMNIFRKFIRKVAHGIPQKAITLKLHQTHKIASLQLHVKIILESLSVLSLQKDIDYPLKNVNLRIVRILAQ